MSEERGLIRGRAGSHLGVLGLPQAAQVMSSWKMPSKPTVVALFVVASVYVGSTFDKTYQSAE